MIGLVAVVVAAAAEVERAGRRGRRGPVGEGFLGEGDRAPHGVDPGGGPVQPGDVLVDLGEGLRVGAVGFVDDEEGGPAELLAGEGPVRPPAGIGRGVEDVDDAADLDAGDEAGVGEAVEEVVGLGHPGGFEPGLVKAGIVGEVEEGLPELGGAGAADAPGGEFREAGDFGGRLAFRFGAGRGMGEEGGVDVHLAEIVHHDRRPGPREAGGGEEVAEDRRLASAEEAGEEMDDEAAGGRHAERIPPRRRDSITGGGHRLGRRDGD